MPHDALDPVPVACEIVTAIQAMVTRQFPVSDPVVATVAKIEAGTAHNVIADVAALKGTLRTLSPGNRERLREALDRVATHIAAAHGMTAELAITPGFPVTVCDPRAVDLGENVAISMAQNGFVKGLGAQRPYDAGVVEAKLAGYALLDKDAPDFVALPALPVSRDNLLEAWTQVYSTEPTDNVKASMQ